MPFCTIVPCHRCHSVPTTPTHHWTLLDLTYAVVMHFLFYNTVALFDLFIPNDTVDTCDAGAVVNTRYNLSSPRAIIRGGRFDVRLVFWRNTVAYRLSTFITTCLRIDTIRPAVYHIPPGGTITYLPPTFCHSFYYFSLSFLWWAITLFFGLILYTFRGDLHTAGRPSRSMGLYLRTQFCRRRVVRH